MQKDLGPVMALYPTPVTLVGTVSEGTVNWLPIAHVGVVEHGHLLISMDKAHTLSDAAILKNGTVSVSLVRREMLPAVDYCGILKGEKTSKADVFPYHFDEVTEAPIPDEAPLCMTCRVVKTMEVGNFRNYVLKPVHTYVQEEYINDKGRVDYEKMQPMLFEFQNAQYLATGNVVGKCWSIGKEYRP